MGTSMRKNNQRGFSLIEILMVLILIAVLAAIAINAFINFRTEAREASLQGNLKVLRTAIAAQYAQMQLRCGSDAAAVGYPTLASLNNNDITTGASGCTLTTEVPDSDKRFVQGAIPVPPMGTIATVLACGGAGDCIRGNATACASAGATFTDQWCYNTATGEIWLDDNPAVLPDYEAF